MRTSIKFPTLQAGQQTIQFGPDCILVSTKREVIALNYSDVQCESAPTRFIETESVPEDATVVGKTWRFKAKDGGPDRRFNNNYEIPVCLYSEMTFRSSGGLNEQMHFSNVGVIQFANVISSLSAQSEKLAPTTNAEIMRSRNTPNVLLGIFSVVFALSVGVVVAGDKTLQLMTQNLLSPMPASSPDKEKPKSDSQTPVPAKQRLQIKEKAKSQPQPQPQKRIVPSDDPWRAFR